MQISNRVVLLISSLLIEFVKLLCFVGMLWGRITSGSDMNRPVRGECTTIPISGLTLLCRTRRMARVSLTVLSVYSWGRIACN